MLVSWVLGILTLEIEGGGAPLSGANGAFEQHLVILTTYIRSDSRPADAKDALVSSAEPKIPRRVEEIGGGGAPWLATPPPSAASPPFPSTRLGLFGPDEHPRASWGSRGRKSDRV